MFGKNATPSWQAQSSEAVTLIAGDCQITGSLIVKGNARIDGKVDGSIQATGDVIIGQGAVVRADIEAKTVSIAGEVHGDIKTTDTLELGATARLFGDICTKQFKVEQGAKFVGTSQLLEPEPKPAHAGLAAEPDVQAKSRNDRPEKRKNHD